MDPSRGGDSRYNLNYSMSSIGLSLADQADLYGNPAAVLGASGVGRNLMHVGGNNIVGGGGAGLSSSSSSGQCQNLVGSSSNSNSGGNNNNNNNNSGQHQSSRGIKRNNSDCYDDHHHRQSQQMSSSLQGLDSCTGGSGGGGGGGGVQQNNGQQDVIDDTTNYTSLQTSKKSPPANGKKTKGRVKIKMEYIDNKLRRYTTFSKRKTGIMKKAYELSTLTGTQVMLLVASETGHVYTFATRKLQPMITSEAGKQLIQTCLNSPDPPTGGSSGDQRMSATGFEETELSYNIADEDSKDDRSPCSSGNESDDSSDIDSPGPPSVNNNNNNNSSQTVVSESPILVTSSSPHQHSSQINAAASSASSSSAQYDIMKLAGMNNVLYPSTLANIPQEVLLSLVQAGHLQLHTEDDGSGHQFITIPLSMTTSSGNNTNSISGNNNTGLSTSVGQQQLSINNKIHVKDFGGKATATPATTTSSTLSSMNGRESPTLRIKKEIE